MTAETLTLLVKITRTDLVNGYDIPNPNLTAIEYLLIDLTLWQHTTVFKLVLGLLTILFIGSITAI